MLELDSSESLIDFGVGSYPSFLPLIGPPSFRLDSSNGGTFLYTTFYGSGGVAEPWDGTVWEGELDHWSVTVFEAPPCDVGGGNPEPGPRSADVCQIETVPEPASLLLLGTGALGLFAKARRRRRTNL